MLTSFDSFQKFITSRIKSSVAALTALFLLINITVSHKIRSTGGFYICNKGISFGISLSNTFWYIWAIFALLTIVYIFKLFIKHTQHNLFVFSLVLALTGIFSNIIDRVLYGCVSDYLIISRSLPIINIADIEIFIGLSTILFFILKKNNPARG